MIQHVFTEFMNNFLKEMVMVYDLVYTRMLYVEEE